MHLDNLKIEIDKAQNGWHNPLLEQTHDVAGVAVKAIRAFRSRKENKGIKAITLTVEDQMTAISLMLWQEQIKNICKLDSIQIRHKS
jgi:DNA polymerase III alpha subunit